jgi:outer membrane receptor protein involved in Fe transport
MAGAQTRLSGGDLDDERIGASRSRDDIAAVFQGTRVSPFIRQGVFTPTGETLIQIQERVLPGVSSNTRVPLYQSTAGWLTWNMQGGVLLGERMSLNAGAFNLLDRNYRVHGSGIDAPGFNVFMGVRVLF